MRQKVFQGGRQENRELRRRRTGERHQSESAQNPAAFVRAGSCRATDCANLQNKTADSEEEKAGGC